MDKDKILGCTIFLAMCAAIYKSGEKAGEKRMYDMLEVWSKAAERFSNQETE